MTKKSSCYKIDESNKLYYNSEDRKYYLNKDLLDDLSIEILEEISVSSQVMDNILKDLMYTILKISIIGREKVLREFLELWVKDRQAERYWKTLGTTFFLDEFKILKKRLKSQIWVINTSKLFRSISKFMVSNSNLGVFILDQLKEEEYDILDIYRKSLFHKIYLVIDENTMFNSEKLLENYDFTKIVKFSKNNDNFLKEILDSLLYEILDEIYADFGGVEISIELETLLDFKNFKNQLGPIYRSYFP